MKRIDDKIKEIEKKDRTSRWLYYIIIAGIIGFLYFASTTRKKMDLKDAQIDELTIKNSETYKELDSTYSELEKTYEALKNSLEPEEYWDYIRNENTVEGYISFITNDWGIDKSKYMTQAYNRIMDDDSNTKADGYEGWIFVGSINNANEYTSGNSEGDKVIKIVYRNGKDNQIANSEPLVGDVVQLVSKRNRITYSRKDKVGKGSYKNEQGFRNKTKAIVVDRYQDPNNTNFYLKLKYY
jgi:hypothetical protein